MSTPSIDSLAALQEALGHKFSDATLLATALTHASVVHGAKNNERLEFLGDRVLSLAMAQWLYTAYPQEKEGDLAKRHALLVAKSSLLQVAEALDLAHHVRLSHGESKSGGSKKDTILADCLEAIIGAMFLDGGYVVTDAFIHRHWGKLVSTHTAPPEDAKSKLQVWAQQRGLPLPEYRLVSRTGPDHQPVFEVEVSVRNAGAISAVAPSKQSAEKEAATRMLDKIAETKG